MKCYFLRLWVSFSFTRLIDFLPRNINMGEAPTPTAPALTTAATTAAAAAPTLTPTTAAPSATTTAAAEAFGAVTMGQ